MAQNGLPLSHQTLMQHQNTPLPVFEGISFPSDANLTDRQAFDQPTENAGYQSAAIAPSAYSTQPHQVYPSSISSSHTIHPTMSQKQPQMLSTSDSTFTASRDLASAPSNLSQPVNDIHVQTSNFPSANQSETSTSPWAMSDQQRDLYLRVFAQADKNGDGFISIVEAQQFFGMSGLAPAILGQVWRLSDVDGDGSLNQAEFAIAMHLSFGAKNNLRLPATLPEVLDYRKSGSIALVATSGTLSLPVPDSDPFAGLEGDEPSSVEPPLTLGVATQNAQSPTKAPKSPMSKSPRLTSPIRSLQVSSSPMPGIPPSSPMTPITPRLSRQLSGISGRGSQMGQGGMMVGQLRRMSSGVPIQHISQMAGQMTPMGTQLPINNQQARINALTQSAPAVDAAAVMQASIDATRAQAEAQKRAIQEAAARQAAQLAYQQELQAWRSQTEELLIQQEQLKRELARYSKRAQAVNAEILAAERELAEVEKESSSVQAELEKHNSELKQIEQEQEEKNTAIKELDEHKRLEEARREELKLRADDGSTALEKEQAALDQINEDIESVKVMQEHVLSEISSNKKKLEQADKDCEMRVAQLDSLKTDVQNILELQANHLSALESRRAQQSRLRREELELVEVLAGVRKELHSLNGEAEELATAITRLMAQARGQNGQTKRKKKKKTGRLCLEIVVE